MRKFAIFIFYLLHLLTANGQNTEVLAVDRNKSFIKVLKNFAVSAPEGKAIAILKLDSLIAANNNDKENIILLTEAKTEIEALIPSFKKSKNIDVLSKQDLKGFQVTKDKFTKSTFITPIYGLWGGQFQLYIANTDGLVMLRFVVEYRASDWLFFDKVTMLTGDEQIEYYDYDTKKSVYDNIEEKSDILVNDALLKFLEKVVMNQEVDVRLEGDKRVYDTKISKKQIKSISNALMLYRKLVDE